MEKKNRLNLGITRSREDDEILLYQVYNWTMLFLLLSIFIAMFIAFYYAGAGVLPPGEEAVINYGGLGLK